MAISSKQKLLPSHLSMKGCVVSAALLYSLGGGYSLLYQSVAEFPLLSRYLIPKKTLLPNESLFSTLTHASKSPLFLFTISFARNPCLWRFPVFFDGTSKTKLASLFCSVSVAVKSSLLVALTAFDKAFLSLISIKDSKCLE